MSVRLMGHPGSCPAASQQGLWQCPPVVGGLPHSFQGSPFPLQPLVAWLYAVHLLVVNWS